MSENKMNVTGLSILTKQSYRTSIGLTLLCVTLLGCRGDDQQEVPRFPTTQDPDAFVAFLNQAPGIPRNGELIGSVDNVKDFPEAYYNTIDPTSNRDSFDKWRIQNGFLNEDLSEAECDPANCQSAHVTFRDTKDLGYGRNMFMRWNTDTNDVAVYVENFQVDAIPGVPYGPLNFEALVENDRSWNFGVNAIEFSAYPGAVGEKQFTKFYNFAGDGKRANSASGTQQHFVDLDNRGDKPMPGPCIVCHGGHGRTLVYEDLDGVKRIAPTTTDGIPGDVQAHMQSIELNTLQFADRPGFTEADNRDGVRLINAAILATYRQRLSTFTARTGDWDPSLAIEIAEGRYNGNINTENAPYNDQFVPANWSGGNEALYTSTFGPNCMVCHSLRGSGLNPSLSFNSVNEFSPFLDRIDHLVYERGLMPLGLLNYSNFWDSGSQRPVVLAQSVNQARVDSTTNTVALPGAPVAVITAPPIATGFNSATREVFDIPVSAQSSAFNENIATYEWSLPSESATDLPAIITQTSNPANAVIRAARAGNIEISLTVTSASGETSNERFIMEIADENGDTSNGLSPPPPASEIAFYGGDESIQSVLNGTCVSCHSPNRGFTGIPLYYQACGDPDNKDAYEYLYRTVLARVNLSSPQDSLFLRKPTNGSTDFQLSGREASAISNYHAGLNQVDDSEFSRLVSWVLTGAPKGDDPTVPPECS